MPDYILYSYYRSSASAKIRSALHYKAIPFETRSIHLLKSENFTPEYTQLNPEQKVPTLITPSGDILFESTAILEYLEQVHHDSPLIPFDDAVSRALVRIVVNVCACSIQPLSNSRTIARVKTIHKDNDASAWLRDVFVEGLNALESILKKHSNGDRYCVKDTFTMADICLAPTLESMIRFNAPLDDYPTVKAVYENIKLHPAIVAGDWHHQPDTPDEFRV